MVTNMTDSNNSNDDSFIDPSSLKGDRGEPIDPAEFIETIKKSEGVRWPGALFLMGITLLIGLGLGAIFLRNNDTPAVVIDGPEINIPDINVPNIEIPDIDLPTLGEDAVLDSPIPLIGRQLIQPEGTFTEWYVRKADTNLDLHPRFVDLTWHPGTERIYLVARDKNLYWIDSSREQIEFKDISLQVGESLPWFEAVVPIDQDRILLLMSHTEEPIIIYNVKTDRVEKRFGQEGENGELGTFDQIQEVKTSPNGTIYILNRYRLNDEWTDQIQVFSSEGEPILEFPLLERFADTFGIEPDGSIFVFAGYRQLFEHDLDGDLLQTIERDTFDYAEDMVFDRDGSLYFVRTFDAWLVEFQPDGEFGDIYSPAHDFDAEVWDLGEVKDPNALVLMPAGDEFVILDGFDFQRIFLFQPNS